VLRKEFVVVPPEELSRDREQELEKEGFERIGASPGLSGWLFGRSVPSENPGGMAIFDWCGTIRMSAEGERAVKLLEAAAQGLVVYDNHLQEG
jgi:hypothetical protein